VPVGTFDFLLLVKRNVVCKIKLLLVFFTVQRHSRELALYPHTHAFTTFVGTSE